MTSPPPGVVSFENRRLARIASADLRQMFNGDWSRDDERKLAEWYEELDALFAEDDAA